MGLIIIGIEALDLASSGLGILWKRLFLHEAEKMYQTIKKENPADPSLKNWKQWLAKEKKRQIKEERDYGIFAGYLATNRIVELIGMFGSMGEPLFSVLSFLSITGTVGIQSWSYYHSRNDDRKQQRMVTALQPPLLPAPEFLDKILETKRTDFHRIKNDFIALLNKEIQQWQNEKDNISLEETFSRFAKYGLFCDQDERNKLSSTKEVADVFEKIQHSPHQLENLAEGYTKKREEKIALTRQALQTLALEKHRLVAEFYHRKRRDGKIMALATIATWVSWVAVKILLVTSVLVVPSILVILSGGLPLFFLSLSFLIFGLYLMIRKHPHLLKTHVTGKQIRKHSALFAVHWHAWREQQALGKMMRIAERLHQGNEDDLKKLDDSITTYRKRRGTYLKKVEKYSCLENQILEAEWKDFLRTQPVYQQLNPTEILSEAIYTLKESLFADEDMMQWYRTHFGDREGHDTHREQIQERLKGFCSMNEKTILENITKKA